MPVDVLTIGVVCADVMVRPVEAMPEKGHLALVDCIEMHIGGLAGVTAAVVCQLGGSAAMIGKVGDDGFGEFIVRFLRDQGVRVDTIERVRGTGTSASIVLIDASGERSFLHQVGATAVITETDIPGDTLGRARVFHWGGPAITPGLDGEPMGRVMKRAQELGVKTSMDTCFDGRGIWYAHIEASLPHLNIVMSSIEEARHYTGKDDEEAIADFYLSFGPDVVLVKLGDQGVFVKNSREAHHIPAHRVDVVDTTGAGDAACGGFLYAYLNGWNLRDCARLANACGGLTVQSMGGAEAIQSLEQATALMEANPHG